MYNYNKGSVVIKVNRSGMNKRQKWHAILLLGLVLSLSTSLIACGVSQSSERHDIEAYLKATEAIIDEATNTALKVSNLYKTAHKLQRQEIIRQFAMYAKEYDNLLKRFVPLKCPQECLKLREYLIDGITKARLEVMEFGAAFATGNVEHLYKAESYYAEAQRSFTLAVIEWNRLKRK